MSFWIVEVGFLFEGIRIVTILLSGGIFPLEVFGERFVQVMNLLPFKYTVSYPINVLNGADHDRPGWRGTADAVALDRAYAAGLPTCCGAWAAGATWRWEAEMGELLREIKKHLLIYVLFVKNSLMAQMEYRFNFIGNLAMESRLPAGQAVLHRGGLPLGGKINGLSPDEILLFIGTFMTMTAVYAGLFMINNFRLRSKIKDGDLDSAADQAGLAAVHGHPAPGRPDHLQRGCHRRGDGGGHRLGAAGHPGDPVHGGRLPGFHGDQLAGELQPVPAAADPLLLADEHQRHRRDHRLVLGLQQHADGHLPRHWIQQIGVFMLPIFVITNFPRPCSCSARCRPSTGLGAGSAIPLAVGRARPVEEGPAHLCQREQLRR